MSPTSVKTFIKENFALVAGITLPLILMALFFVAGRTAVVAVDPPRYSLVFAVNYDRNWTHQPWRIGLDDEDIVIRFRPVEGQPGPYHNKPELYVFDRGSLYARKIDIDFEAVTDGRVADPDLDALNGKRLIASPESPDGYRLENYYHSGGGGLAGEIFGFGRYRHNYALVKGARAIPLKGPQIFYQAEFIAWIEE